MLYIVIKIKIDFFSYFYYYTRILLGSHTHPPHTHHTPTQPAPPTRVYQDAEPQHRCPGICPTPNPCCRTTSTARWSRPASASASEPGPTPHTATARWSRSAAPVGFPRSTTAVTPVRDPRAVHSSYAERCSRSNRPSLPLPGDATGAEPAAPPSGGRCRCCGSLGGTRHRCSPAVCVSSGGHP